PWSNCDLASSGTFPFKVISDDSSTSAVIRGAIAEFCAGNTELQRRAVEKSSALATAWKGRERRGRIVVDLDPFSGEKPPKIPKVVVPIAKFRVEAGPPATPPRTWMQKPS